GSARPRSTGPNVTSTCANSGTRRGRQPSKRWKQTRSLSTVEYAARRSRKLTPARATRSRSQATSAGMTSSTRRCQRSQRPTPTRTSATTTLSDRPPSPVASRQRPACDDETAPPVLRCRSRSGTGLRKRCPGVAGSLKLANQVQKPNLVRYPDTRSALDCANQVRELRLELRLLAHFETSSRVERGQEVQRPTGRRSRSRVSRRASE